MTHVPVDGRPFTLTMGLRALDILDWIEIDDNYDSELQQKRDLLLKQRHQVLAVLPTGERGSRETLSMLKDHLPRRFPERFPACPDVDTARHPLESASLLVQEDLAVMSPIDGQWVLTAACVCFPSRWDLTEKIGGTLFSIHDPVPHYAERLGDATHAMFGKFTPERPVWRVNWTVIDTPELYQPAAPPLKPAPAGEFAERTFLRTERQTMRVLPCGDVLFTIRTHVRSLAELDRADPKFRRDLVATMSTTSPETRAYKGWGPIWRGLLDWGDS